MQSRLLDVLRCPFCGTRLSVVDNEALVRTGDSIEQGVLGCECCAFPVVAGIPVLVADDTTRTAMQQLEAGQRDEALFTLLGLDAERGAAFDALLGQKGATYRDALAILSPDAEGTYFLYRFSDPTFLVAQALIHAIAEHTSARARYMLDMCGGSGHLTRVLTGMGSARGTLLADVYFWKLWLAKRFTAPSCEPICCDGNDPLPFAPGVCSFILLSDAFPYIWRRRLLAEELIRAAGPEGLVLLPHLHSSLVENFAAGMPLTPASYRDLFAALEPRLFSDRALLTQVLEQRALDLGADLSPAGLHDEPSLTLIATRHRELFRVHPLRAPGTMDVAGELRVNPLYRIEPRGATSRLTLAFPTPEYEEEYGHCRRYLPDTIDVPGDATIPRVASSFGDDYAELRRRHVIIDVPPHYC